MGVLKTLCIVGAAIYLDRSGRRPMLLGSVAGMRLSLLVIGSAFSEACRSGRHRDVALHDVFRWASGRAAGSPRLGVPWSSREMHGAGDGREQLLRR